MRSKKSQIQIMETIAILLIFFLLIVIAFTFYLRTASFTQTQKAAKSQELESIRVSQAISFLPELQCSSKNIIEENCFDYYKLNAFEANLDKNEVYYPFFYFSDIIVKEIYPSTLKEWLLYSRTKAGTSFKTSIPILIYNPISKTRSFGVLEVNYYPID
jgi:hypothetical protein